MEQILGGHTVIQSSYNGNNKYSVADGSNLYVHIYIYCMYQNPEYTTLQINDLSHKLEQAEYQVIIIL